MLDAMPIGAAQPAARQGPIPSQASQVTAANSGEVKRGLTSTTMHAIHRWCQYSNGPVEHIVAPSQTWAAPENSWAIYHLFNLSLRRAFFSEIGSATVLVRRCQGLRSFTVGYSNLV